jgi:hypothetical protein
MEKMAAPGDPPLQADALLWPLLLPFSISQDAPESKEGRNCLKYSRCDSWVAVGVGILKSILRILFYSGGRVLGAD